MTYCNQKTEVKRENAGRFRGLGVKHEDESPITQKHDDELKTMR